MRICLDTNILISYLLDPTSDGPPSKIVRAGFIGEFDLVLSELIIVELTRKIATKLYRTKRIPSDELKSFVRLVRTVASIVSVEAKPVPAVTPSRDPDDDYLIAHSVVENVDYLVSGDKDLLALGSVMDVRIVSPADFLVLLDSLRE